MSYEGTTTVRQEETNEGDRKKVRWALNLQETFYFTPIYDPLVDRKTTALRAQWRMKQLRKLSDKLREFQTEGFSPEFTRKT